MSKTNQDVEWQPTRGCVLTDAEFPTNDATTADVDAKMLGHLNSFACTVCANMEDNTEATDISGICEIISETPEPKPLGPWSASIILVNTISMGYILNPSGKRSQQNDSIIGFDNLSPELTTSWSSSFSRLCPGWSPLGGCLPCFGIHSVRHYGDLYPGSMYSSGNAQGVHVRCFLYTKSSH
jgi:hypothetical protein